MEQPTCPICRMPREGKRPGKFCKPKCRWLNWRHRKGLEAQQALDGPRATLPPDLRAQIPAGPGEQEAALRVILLGRAPAGACGYRVGTSHGNFNLLRWFPSSLRRRNPIFFLDPFEQPLVPERAIYTIAYLDERGEPIGGPRFTLDLQRVDAGVRFCDGDRSLRTRRWMDR